MSQARTTVAPVVSIRALLALILNALMLCVTWRPEQQAPPTLKNRCEHSRGRNFATVAMTTHVNPIQSCVSLSEWPPR